MLFDSEPSRVAVVRQREGGRGGEPRKLPPPEGLRGSAILTAEPLNMAPIRRGQGILQRVGIAFEDFPKHDSGAPAIQQGVMVAPTKSIFRRSRTNQCKPHGRSRGEIEAFLLIAVKKLFEPRLLLAAGEAAPIECGPLRRGFLQDDLYRLFQTHPME